MQLAAGNVVIRYWLFVICYTGQLFLKDAVKDSTIFTISTTSTIATA
jgi:hypothetical protein